MLLWGTLTKTETIFFLQMWFSVADLWTALMVVLKDADMLHFIMVFQFSVVFHCWSRICHHNKLHMCTLPLENLQGFWSFDFPSEEILLITCSLQLTRRKVLQPQKYSKFFLARLLKDHFCTHWGVISMAHCAVLVYPEFSLHSKTLSDLWFFSVQKLAVKQFISSLKMQTECTDLRYFITSLK